MKPNPRIWGIFVLARQATIRPAQGETFLREVAVGPVLPGCCQRAPRAAPPAGPISMLAAKTSSVSDQVFLDADSGAVPRAQRTGHLC